MRAYDHPEDVLHGIAYLDAEYPDWWRNVDDTRLDMYDPLGHVLAQVCDCLVYETREVTFWSRRELQDHGFMPKFGMTRFIPLTNEWALQIVRLRSERK